MKQTLFFRLMRTHIMFVAYFCKLYLSHAEYNSAVIKVDWLAAGVLQREVVGAGLVIVPLS